MALVWTGANFAYGNTQTSDIQIDARELIDAPVNIGPVGYRAWLRCRVEVVADARDSSEQSLHVYAKVSDYLDSGVSGGINVYPKYYQRFSNGTAYSYGRLNEGDTGTTKGGFILKGWQVDGGTTAGIFKNSSTSSLYQNGYPEWTVYFDLGAVTPGSSVITPVYKVGWVPDAWRWSGESSLTMTPKTVTIVYDANAGSDSVGQNPSSQIRFAGWSGCGFSTTVADATYQRPGWAFTGWNTERDGSGDDFAEGSSYSGTSDITLYAQWERTTKTLHYDENRPAGTTGTIQPGVPADVTVDANVDITVSTTNPAGTTNYLPPWTFRGWAYTSTATDPVVFPDNKYTSQNSATLYAVWSTDYVRPSFLDGACKAFRSTSSGQPEQTESYLTVEGTVLVNQTTILGVGNNQPESLVISGAPQDMTFTASDFTDNGDGTWSFSKTTTSPILNPGTTYSLTATFKDTFMTTYPSQTGRSAPLIRTGITISVAFITFSTNARGMSAAFGAQAAATVTGDDNVNNGPGRIDVNMNAYFHGKVLGIPVDGTTIDYNGSGQLSYIGTTSSYTEDSGGTSLGNFDYNGSNWPTTYAYTRNGSTISGCGWREIKHAEGRLEKWVWGWQQGQSSSDTYHMSNNWRELPIPAGTAFSDTPNLLMLCRTSNTGVGVWATQQGATGTTMGSWSSSGWTDGSSIGFSYTAYNHAGSAVAYPGKVLFQAYLDGHWQ